MGNLNIDWIDNLKKMAGGNDETRFNIMYPCENTVKQSYLGGNSGGTIHCNRKFWHNSTFPQQLVRDCKLISNGLLHAKVY